MKRANLTILFFLLLLALCACAPKPPAEEVPPTPYEGYFTQERVTEVEQYESETYTAFYEAASADAVIPGLKQDFIPQGMDYSEDRSVFYISGYFKSKKQYPSSVLFAVSKKSGALIGAYDLKKPDGSDLTGHVGGVAVTEKNVFIADGGKLYRFPLSHIDALGQSGALIAAEAVITPTNASFCNYANGVLYVGDFYLEPNYKTADWRHLEDANGKEYGAWCIGYRLTDTMRELSSAALAGRDYAIPDLVLCLDTKVQGFTVYGDTVVLSRSHGRVNDALISYYRFSSAEAADTAVTLGEKSVPVYFLSEDRLQDSIVTPPMTEAVCTDGDALCILFESAASYYKDGGGKNPVDRIYRIPLP